MLIDSYKYNNFQNCLTFDTLPLTCCCGNIQTNETAAFLWQGIRISREGKSGINEFFGNEIYTDVKQWPSDVKISW